MKVAMVHSIFSVYETALCWKKMPSRCFMSREKSVSGFRDSNDRLTLNLFSWAPKSLWMVTIATKLKDACSLEEKL